MVPFVILKYCKIQTGDDAPSSLCSTFRFKWRISASPISSRWPAKRTFSACVQTSRKSEFSFQESILEPAELFMSSESVQSVSCPQLMWLKVTYFTPSMCTNLQGGCCHLSQHHGEERHAAGGQGAAGFTQVSQTAAGGGAGDGTTHTRTHTHFGLVSTRPGQLVPPSSFCSQSCFSSDKVSTMQDGEDLCGGLPYFPHVNWDNLHNLINGNCV